MEKKEQFNEMNLKEYNDSPSERLSAEKSVTSNPLHPDQAQSNHINFGYQNPMLSQSQNTDPRTQSFGFSQFGNSRELDQQLLRNPNIQPQLMNPSIYAGSMSSSLPNNPQTNLSSSPRETTSFVEASTSPHLNPCSIYNQSNDPTAGFPEACQKISPPNISRAQQNQIYNLQACNLQQQSSQISQPMMLQNMNQNILPQHYILPQQIYPSQSPNPSFNMAVSNPIQIPSQTQNYYTNQMASKDQPSYSQMNTQSFTPSSVAASNNQSIDKLLQKPNSPCNNQSSSVALSPHLGNQSLNQNNNLSTPMMPNPQSLQLELLNLQTKINMVANQMAQIQNNIAAISNNPAQPNNIQMINFLNQRFMQLKTVFCQMSAQSQMMQQHMRNMVMQPNLSQMQSPYINQQGVPMMQSNLMRPNNIRSAYQSMPNASLIMPPGLNNRFPGPRSIFSFNQQPRMLSQLDLNAQKKFQKGGRRRRRFSSESEEEEEITTSDADSTSALSPTSTIPEDTELRRSSRIQHSKSYISEVILDSDEENESSKKGNESPATNAQDLIPFHASEQIDGKIMLIERILADRIKNEPSETDPSASNIIEEYYIKFKYYSYVHCEWCTVEELKRRDRNALSKIKRYNMKKKENPFLYVDDDPFNPDYIEIDRIIDIKQTTDPINPGQMINCYLVKWCSLPYDECTWEFEEIVDEIAVEDFKRRTTLPPLELLSYKPKPNPYQWQKMSTSPIYKNNNMLREYQLEGINWLLYEYFIGTNCILADEMGLGKTIQSIAFLVEVRKLGIRGPFLIVAPLSTIGNWYREFTNWSDLNCVVLHGAASARNIIHKYELFFNNTEQYHDIYKFEVLITTYEMILSENKFLSTVRWRIAIIDEAHRLKNRKCKLLSQLSNLMIEHRILLTGTPLQNTLDELLSLLHFLDPARAQSLEQLMQQNSGKLETNMQVQQIQSFLKPVILRRLKEDVEKNIAPKEETIIEVEMTAIQKKVYRGILERNLSFLSKGTSSTNLPNLMNIMMELRKCCNHPFLNNGVEDKILVEYTTAHPELDKQTIFKKALIESSGKLVLVDKLLPKLRDNGHKMLIFSQMVRVLDLLEDYLVTHGYIFERIDGSVRGNLRQAAIDRFSKPDSDRTVFLLCTKAGGLGINLTAADTVIIFDSDWNPQNDIQAQARCHRIGQNKAVKVYRLICRKTYEREMFDRASLKLGLDKAVLQDINTTVDDKGQLNTTRTQLSKKEVEELLKRGAYAAIMEEDYDASAKFCSEDIDQILQRRAVVIQLAGATKGSTFAKASFNADLGGEQVDIDDPDFWQKWAKSAKVNVNKELEFDSTPRIRKPIKSRGEGDDDDYEVNYEELAQEYATRRRDSHLQRTSWPKKECLRVEKSLLTYGWGRWNEILSTLKSSLYVYDVEQISKSILVCVWHVSKCDPTFSDFVEKAIRMTLFKSRNNERDTEDFVYQPHSKRTRNKKIKHKIKNDKTTICLVQCPGDWRNTDIDSLVFDENYKKHLIHCSNKILIRLRLLFYIEHYILRDFKEDINVGVHVNDIPLPLVNSIKVTASFPEWWDNVCDRSLVIGTFRHGYEKYFQMKNDPQLCFLEHIPEHQNIEIIDNKKRGRKKKIITPSQSDDDNMIESQVTQDLDKTDEIIDDNNSPDSFPSIGELNVYLKRLVMGYWKSRSKINKKDIKSKWIKKEEQDFYKVVTRFSILLDDNKYVWNNFRKYGNFDKKDDNMMTIYYENLIKRSQSLISENNNDRTKDSDGYLTVKKALKILNRVKLFEMIRDAIIYNNMFIVFTNAKIDFNLFPPWWSVQADVDLVRSSYMYGIKNNDFGVFTDENYIFHSVLNDMIKTKDEKLPNVKDLRILLRWPKQQILCDRIHYLCSLLLDKSLDDMDDGQPISQFNLTKQSVVSDEVVMAEKDKSDDAIPLANVSPSSTDPLGE